MNNQDYATIGIFAGAGGLDTGMTQAGLEFDLAIDFDKAACETYKLNHPKTTVWNRDISTVTKEEIKKIIGEKPVILNGGPPCQSWSAFKTEIDGSKKGLDDKRGLLIYEYLRIAEELQPVISVFENVPYMVENSKHLAEFEIFKEELNKRTGLVLEYRILDAFDYGSAQLRKRVIMIGTKPGIPNPFNYLKKVDGPKTLKDALVDCPSSEYFHFRKTDVEQMKLIGQGECWKHLPPQIAFEHMNREYRGICKQCNHSFSGKLKCPKCESTNIKNGFGITSYLRRLSWNKPSPTVCAVPTNKTHGLMGHPTEQRALSIRECARIQGFPDSYEFVGTIFEQQKQIGNAVAVQLGKAIGLAVIEALNNMKNTVKSNESTLLEFIVIHPERFILTELEKDLIRIVYKRYKANEGFTERHSVYLVEIAKKLLAHTKKKSVSTVK